MAEYWVPDGWQANEADVELAIAVSRYELRDCIERIFPVIFRAHIEPPGRFGISSQIETTEHAVLYRCATCLVIQREGRLAKTAVAHSLPGEVSFADEREMLECLEQIPGDRAIVGRRAFGLLARHFGLDPACENHRLRDAMGSSKLLYRAGCEMRLEDGRFGSPWPDGIMVFDRKAIVIEREPGMARSGFVVSKPKDGAAKLAVTCVERIVVESPITRIMWKAER